MIWLVRRLHCTRTLLSCCHGREWGAKSEQTNWNDLSDILPGLAATRSRSCHEYSCCRTSTLWSRQLLALTRTSLSINRAVLDNFFNRMNDTQHASVLRSFALVTRTPCIHWFTRWPWWSVHSLWLGNFLRWCYAKFDDLYTLQPSCLVISAKYHSDSAVLASVNHRTILELIEWLYEWSVVWKKGNACTISGNQLYFLYLTIYRLWSISLVAAQFPFCTFIFVEEDNHLLVELLLLFYSYPPELRVYCLVKFFLRVYILFDIVVRFIDNFLCNFL